MLKNAINKLALSPEEHAAHTKYTGKIIHDMESTGLDVKPVDLAEIDMGVMRDIQARRIPPNTPVPPRRRPINYLRTITGATGSLRTAMRCLLSPGSWTTSGGSHKLAHDNGMRIAETLDAVEHDQGRASFLEVGGGYAGLHGAETADCEPRGIGELVAHFGERIGTTVEIHITNLSQWHTDLPKGIQEHTGVIGSTLKTLSEEGISPESVDLIYSQCAVYFDRRISVFIQQASELLKRSVHGGYLIFNGKTEEDDAIVKTAGESGLSLERKFVLGGMNGTLYIFRKI